MSNLLPQTNRGCAKNQIDRERRRPKSMKRVKIFKFHYADVKKLFFYCLNELWKGSAMDLVMPYHYKIIIEWDKENYYHNQHVLWSFPQRISLWFWNITFCASGNDISFLIFENKHQAQRQQHMSKFIKTSNVCYAIEIMFQTKISWNCIVRSM